MNHFSVTEKYFFLVIQGKNELAEELIKKKAVDINAQDNEGRTPLYFCVLYGIVYLFISRNIVLQMYIAKYCLHFFYCINDHTRVNYSY